MEKKLFDFRKRKYIIIRRKLKISATIQFYIYLSYIEQKKKERKKKSPFDIVSIIKSLNN